MRTAKLESTAAYLRWRGTPSGRDMPLKPWLTYWRDWGGWADFLGRSFKGPRLTAEAFKAERAKRSPLRTRSRPPGSSGPRPRSGASALTRIKMSQPEPVAALRVRAGKPSRRIRKARGKR